jgi:GT2 family glycosyltransferase
LKVSAIIVNYKVPYHLCLCLGSLQLALKGLEAEIIVVDNDSQDNTSSLIKQYYPDVNYIQNASNVGFSKANNLAIKKAKGEFICLINPDTVIGPTTIKEALNKHHTIDKCGIIGVRLIDGNGNFLPESKINQLTLKTATLKLMGYSASYYNNTLSEDDEGKTDTLVGAFMCFKKQDYIKLEGLDENYFMYGEDIDLSYQFIKEGFDNYYLGKQSILHFKGESTLKDRVYFQRFFDSVKLYFKKHYTNSKVMISIASIFFVLARYFKKNQMLKVNKKNIKYQNIYCIGKDEEFLNLIQFHYKRRVVNLEYSEAKKLPFEQSLVIFNTDTSHYADIIRCMSGNRHTENIFRIRVPNQNILIGSDSSTSQGEIVSLN